MAYANFPFMSTYFWNTFLIVSAFFASVALFHFVRVFLNKPVPWLWLSLGYGLCILAAIAATMGYVVRDAYQSGGVYYLELGIVSYIMWPVAFMFAGATVFNLVQGYRSEKDLFARNRISYPLAGISITLLLSMSNLLPGWKYYPVDQVGNLINASLLSYAVLKYKLLDISIVFRGGLRYAIQTIIVTGLSLTGGSSLVRRW